MDKGDSCVHCGATGPLVVVGDALWPEDESGTRKYDQHPEQIPTCATVSLSVVHSGALADGIVLRPTDAQVKAFSAAIMDVLHTEARRRDQAHVGVLRLNPTKETADVLRLVGLFREAMYATPYERAGIYEQMLNEFFVPVKS